MGETFNKNQFLSKRQIKEMRLSHHEWKALQNWALKRVGYVLGGDGPLGSGVFVETIDGRKALLTAAHVVVGAILTGEISIGSYENGHANVRQTGRRAFGRIHISSTCDSALLFAPESLHVPSLFARPDWTPATAPCLAIAERVIAGGLPRRWTKTNRERRIVEQSRVMLMWTEVVEIGSGTFETRADQDLPDTLGGMSGGPLITFERQLAGIHRAEWFDNSDKIFALSSTRRDQWSDLYNEKSSAQTAGEQGREDLFSISGKVQAQFGLNDTNLIPVDVGYVARHRNVSVVLEQLMIMNSEATKEFQIDVRCQVHGKATRGNVEKVVWPVLRHMNLYPR